MSTFLGINAPLRQVDYQWIDKPLQLEDAVTCALVYSDLYGEMTCAIGNKGRTAFAVFSNGCIVEFIACFAPTTEAALLKLIDSIPEERDVAWADALLDDVPIVELIADEPHPAETQRMGLAPPEFDLYPWQREAIKSWTGSDCRGVAEVVTGAGKTRLATEAIRLSLERDDMIVVLVPTIELMQQWVRELKERFPDVLVNQLYGHAKGKPFRSAILVTLVHSAIKRIGDEDIDPEHSLLVADETHRYGSAAWATALLPNYTRRLGLTATLQRPDDGEVRFLKPFFKKRIIYVDHARARQEGAISPYSIAFIGCNFSKAEEHAFDCAQQNLERAQRILSPVLGIDPINEFGKFMLGVRRLSKHTNPDLYLRQNASRWLKSFVERRRILAEAQGKIDILRSLITCVETAEKTIIFADTKAATENACEIFEESGISARALNSDLARTDRHRVLKDFEDGEVVVIAAPKLLDEGINVPEADLAIVVANSSSRRQLIQRMGRVIRRKSDGRQARIAILYVAGSSEDPTSSFRQDFIKVVEPAATKCAVFEPGTQPAEFQHFLNTLFPEDE